MRALSWIGRLLRGCASLAHRFGNEPFTSPPLGAGWAFEPLERRVLLSADVTGGLLTITGTEGNDAIEIAPGLMPGEVIVLKAPGVDKGTTFVGVDLILVDALAGNDKITVRPGILSTLSTSIATTLIGGAGNDKITGGDGDDFIFGDDMLLGGDGNDILIDLLGHNTIDAGDGNNKVTTGEGDDIVLTGAGKDKVTDKGGTNAIATGGGNDNVTGGSGDDSITAGEGDDRVIDRAGNNIIDLGDGRNRAITGDGNDAIVAGDGDDIIIDRGGANTIDTGAGNDRVSTGDGDDTVELGDGNDRFSTRGGSNIVRGGSGNDDLRGGNGDDDLEGGDDDDKLNGKRGEDRIRGGDGLDQIKLNASAGDDVDDEPPNVVNESENNDRTNRADVFGLGGDASVELVGVAGSGGDEDFFVFTSEVDGTLQFLVDAPGEQFAKLTLIQAAAPGVPEMELAETDPDDSIFVGNAEVVAGRVYFVRMRSTNDDAADYVVHMQMAGADGGGGGDPVEPENFVAETESNDIKAAADLAPLGNDGSVELTGSSANRDDRDFFRFTAENSGTLNVLVTSGDAVFAEVQIEAADGAKVLQTDPDDGINDASGSIVAGVTYFIRVRAPGDAAAGYFVDLTLT